MTVATNADEACQSQFDLYSGIEVVKEELDEYDEYQNEPLHALRPCHQDKKVKLDIETQPDGACSSGYNIPDDDHKVKEKLEQVKSEDQDVVRPQVDCSNQISADVLRAICPSTCKEAVVRPKRKRHTIIRACKLCVYCGVNLEASDTDYKSENSPPSKRNMKPHIALKHTAQLCIDHGLEIDSETNRTSHVSFISHLHLVTRVLTQLEYYNYRVMPACHIFSALGREPLPIEADIKEKEQFFSDFMCEAGEAFRKYRIVYVKGISVPSCYEDLLPVCNTSYADVSWEGLKPPRSNTFAVKHLVSEEQMKILEREIHVNMENIVKTYSDLINVKEKNVAMSI